MVVCEGEWRWSGLGILWRLWRIWFWTSEIKRSQGLYVYWWLKMRRWSLGKKVLVWKKNIKRISFFSLVCQKFKDCTELWFLSLIILIKLKVLLISPTPREEEGTHVLQLYKPLNELPCKEEFLVFFKVQYGLSVWWSFPVSPPWSNSDTALVLLKLHSPMCTFIFQMDLRFYWSLFVIIPGSDSCGHRFGMLGIINYILKIITIKIFFYIQVKNHCSYQWYGNYILDNSYLT